MSLPAKTSTIFMKNVSLEFLRRFLEITLIGAAFSFLLRFLLEKNIFSAKIFYITGIMFLVVFQSLNIWLCRKSNKRVHHYRSRYYTANILAHLFYAFIGLFCIPSNLPFNLHIFGIALTFCYKKYISFNEFLMFFGLFHLITICFVVLAKEFKYIIRRRFKKEKTFYLLDR